MVLTLFDWLLIAGALSAAFNAVQNGLGKEMLHTFLLGIGIIAGVLFFHDPAASMEGPAVAARFVNFGFLLIMLYVLLWVMIRTFGTMFIGNYYGGYRSMFWGGLLSIAKIIALGLGFMLTYAVASPLPTPERIMVMPQLLSMSALVNFADVETDRMYQALVNGGWVNPKKAPETAAPAPSAVSPTTPIPAEVSPTVPVETSPTKL